MRKLFYDFQNVNVNNRTKNDVFEILTTVISSLLRFFSQFENSVKS